MMKDGNTDLNLCLIWRSIIPPIESVAHPLSNLVTESCLIHGLDGLLNIPSYLKRNFGISSLSPSSSASSPTSSFVDPSFSPSSN